jgi:hypothetical protein
VSDGSQYFVLHLIIRGGSPVGFKYFLIALGIAEEILFRIVFEQY